MRMFVKRMRMAWRFRVWPWEIPACALLVSLKPPTDEDIKWGKELAERYGWK